MRIASREGHSYRLEIPEGMQWRGSKVFHADRLRRFSNDPLPGQAPPQPGPEAIADADGEVHDEWEVDEVLASRVYYNRLQYNVRWRGWNQDTNWYPASDFKGAPAKLREFHDKYPDAAGPPKKLAEWEKSWHDGTEAPHQAGDNAPERKGTRKTRRAYSKKPSA